MPDESNIEFNAPHLAEMLAPYAGELVGGALATIKSDGSIAIAVIGRPAAIGSGEVTSDTRFALGSVTKLLTAAIVCQLAEERRFDLNDRLLQWIPEIAELDGGARITIQQLLCHSSGLPDLFEPIHDIAQLIAKLAPFGLLAAPGVIFSYSNAGYALLGELVARVSGSDWESEARRRFLRPLGLEAMSLGEASGPEGTSAVDHIFAPDGSAIEAEMWSRLTGPFAAAGTAATASIADAIQLVGGILLGHGPGSGILIEEPTLAAMQRRHISMPGPSVFGDGWGLGWNVADESNGLVAHMGGTCVYALGCRASGKAAIFLANTPNGAAIGEVLTREAIGVAPRRDKAPVSQGASLQGRASGLNGRYASPTFSIDVAGEAGELVMRTSLDERVVPLAPIGERSYLGKIGLLTTEVNFIGHSEGDGTPLYLHTALRALPRI